MKKKKINLSVKDLDKNLNSINEFLTKKGMSQIRGGNVAPEWGNSNYAESTYVRKP
ncbi:MAG: hypothetical protein Q8R96_09085 [Bacteroidota bacterium]|nr:hypothetical protein [Bacteroidota bacterium]